jgi:hypothetical protein
MMTPLRLVAAAIVLVSALTIGGLWHRHRIETAKATVNQATDAGMAAVQNQDYFHGAREFERARLAVDLLGRTDATANNIRRLSREATALAKLASSSLTECLRETLARKNSGPSELLTMSSLDKDAWVIFDAPVLLAGTEGEQSIVDAPIQLPEGNVRIEIAFPGLRNVSAAEGVSEAPRFIFAAQLQQVSALRGEPPTSVLTLNGKTAFLWTSYDTYASIGYRPFDAESEQQTRSLLERQLAAGHK